MAVAAPTSKKRAARRSNHFANRRPDRKVNQRDIIRTLTPAIPVSELIPQGERCWASPVCDGGFPGMSQGSNGKAYRHHWDAVHPGMSVPKPIFLVQGRRKEEAGLVQEVLFCP